MIKINVTSFLFIFLLNFNVFSLSSQDKTLKEYFPEYLQNNNLSFSMPDGYKESDFLEKKDIFVIKSRYEPLYQIHSIDDNVLIYMVFINYSKKDEDFFKKMYPEKDINLKNDYLIALKNFVSKNTEQNPSDNIYNEKDINYFNEREQNTIGADLAGEYTMKLVTPFQKEYKYLTFRFMTKYYKLWIYTFFFYKEYNNNFANKTLEETLYMLKINN